MGSQEEEVVEETQLKRQEVRGEEVQGGIERRSEKDGRRGDGQTHGSRRYHPPCGQDEYSAD